VDVVTSPQHRQRGHATSLLSQTFAWAQRAGASDAALQVQSDNVAALDTELMLNTEPHSMGTQRLHLGCAHHRPKWWPTPRNMVVYQDGIAEFSIELYVPLGKGFQVARNLLTIRAGQHGLQ